MSNKIRHRMVGFVVSKNRKHMIFLLFMLCVTLVFSQPIFGLYSKDTVPADAPIGSVTAYVQQDSEVIDAQELIILFDISTSMQVNDTEFLAPDAMRQVVNSLPSYWHVGIVTFNTDVVDFVPPLASSRGEVLAVIDNLSYRHFTNSGAGLQMAMELFSEGALGRTILYVTDGEMAAMPTRQATLEAITLAEDVIAEILESDIVVHTLAIGDNFESFHSEKTMGLAHASGGYLFRDLASEEISGTVSTLLFDVLEVERSKFGAAQLTYLTGRFPLRIPYAGVDLVRVLIESESPVTDIVVNGNVENIEIQTGQRFAVIELSNLMYKDISIEFMALGNSNVSVIVEWDLELMADIAEDNSLRLWFSDSLGNNVLDDSFFEGRAVPILVNGSEIQGRIEAGYINLSSDGFTQAENTIQASLHMFGINLLRDAQVNVNLPLSMSVEYGGLEVYGEAAPAGAYDSQRRFNFMPIIIIIGIAILGLCIFIMLRRYQQGGPVRIREELILQDFEGFKSSFKFVGKLDAYIVGADGEEKLVRKFDFNNAHEVSLDDILRKCGIPDEFSGAEDIWFMSEDGALQVANNSNGEVFAGMDKLAKNERRGLTFEENVAICNEIGNKLVINARFLYQA